MKTKLLSKERTPRKQENRTIKKQKKTKTGPSTV